MRGMTRLVQVTEFICLHEAIDIAQNTREFDPLFVRRLHGGKEKYAVCRRLRQGEILPESFLLDVYPKEIV